MNIDGSFSFHEVRPHIPSTPLSLASLPSSSVSFLLLASFLHLPLANSHLTTSSTYARRFFISSWSRSPPSDTVTFTRTLLSARSPSPSLSFSAPSSSFRTTCRSSPRSSIIAPRTSVIYRLPTSKIVSSFPSILRLALRLLCFSSLSPQLPCF